MNGSRRSRTATDWMIPSNRLTSFPVGQFRRRDLRVFQPSPAGSVADARSSRESYLFSFAKEAATLCFPFSRRRWWISAAGARWSAQKCQHWKANIITSSSAMSRNEAACRQFEGNGAGLYVWPFICRHYCQYVALWEHDYADWMTDSNLSFTVTSGGLFVHRCCVASAASLQHFITNPVTKVHRRSQDFVWGCTFFLKKLTTFFSCRLQKIIKNYQFELRIFLTQQKMS